MYPRMAARAKDRCSFVFARSQVTGARRLMGPGLMMRHVALSNDMPAKHRAMCEMRAKGC